MTDKVVRNQQVSTSQNNWVPHVNSQVTSRFPNYPSLDHQAKRQAIERKRERAIHLVQSLFDEEDLLDNGNRYSSTNDFDNYSPHPSNFMDHTNPKYFHDRKSFRENNDYEISGTNYSSNFPERDFPTSYTRDHHYDHYRPNQYSSGHTDRPYKRSFSNNHRNRTYYRGYDDNSQDCPSRGYVHKDPSTSSAYAKKKSNISNEPLSTKWKQPEQSRNKNDSSSTTVWGRKRVSLPAKSESKKWKRPYPPN